MSEKGGKKRSDEIVDFEDDTSAISEKARARVEKAENEAISNSPSERKEKESCENVCYQSSRLKIAAFSALGYLLGIAFIMTLVLMGIRIGQASFFVSSNNSSQKDTVEVLDVDAESFVLHYKIDNKSELSQETGSYLSDVYGSGKEYAVIKSKTQLNRLESIYRGYAKNTEISSLSEFTNTDDAFFGAGSIIAITQESLEYNNAKLSGIYRNESYEITATVSPTGVASEPTDGTIYGTLILVKVNNIQPRVVVVSRGDYIEGEAPYVEPVEAPVEETQEEEYAE